MLFRSWQRSALRIFVLQRVQHSRPLPEHALLCGGTSDVVCAPYHRGALTLTKYANVPALGSAFIDSCLVPAGRGWLLSQSSPKGHPDSIVKILVRMTGCSPLRRCRRYRRYGWNVTWCRDQSFTRIFPDLDDDLFLIVRQFFPQPHGSCGLLGVMRCVYCATTAESHTDPSVLLRFVRRLGHVDEEPL